MHALTGFQRDVPYVIAGTDSPNGLAIKGNLGDYYANVINHGGLYRNLHAQIDRGLVEKGIIDDRANSYSLTEEGNELLAERREWELEPTGWSS